MKTKLFSACCALLFSLSVSAQTFSLFKPATGVLKGSSSTYVTTAAASTDIRALWTGTCSSGTFLRGDGACATAGGGTTFGNSWDWTSSVTALNFTYPVFSGNWLELTDDGAGDANVAINAPVNITLTAGDTVGLVGGTVNIASISNDIGMNASLGSVSIIGNNNVEVTANTGLLSISSDTITLTDAAAGNTAVATLNGSTICTSATGCSSIASFGNSWDWTTSSTDLQFAYPVFAGNALEVSDSGSGTTSVALIASGVTAVTVISGSAESSLIGQISGSDTQQNVGATFDGQYGSSLNSLSDAGSSTSTFRSYNTSGSRESRITTSQSSAVSSITLLADVDGAGVEPAIVIDDAPAGAATISMTADNVTVNGSEVCRFDGTGCPSAGVVTSGTTGHTCNGFSGGLTCSVKWTSVSGVQSCISFVVSGTSNATTFTITGIQSPAPNDTYQSFNVVRVLDNSVTSSGTAVVSSGSNTTLTFKTDLNGSAFTASGTKGVSGNICYAN